MRCVVHAVTRHGHPSGLLQLGDLGGLVCGQDLGDDVVDAELGGDPLGGGAVVPGQHDDLDAQLVQSVDGGAGGGRGVSDRDQPGHSSVDGDHDRGAPTGGQLVPPSAESAEVGSVLLHQRVLPTVTRRPSTLPTAP